MENQEQNKEQEELTAEETPVRAVGSFVWELAKILILALVIILPLRLFIAEPFIVSGSSMFPTFQNKDYLIVDKLTYDIATPKRGDVIVFHYPKDTSQFFIKRIVGLPGEKVQVESGGVILYNNDHPDGMRLDEPYLTSQDITFGKADVVTLGSDEYFVLGDNRLASSDSRAWGILPKNDIVGRALIRLFPVNDAKVITSPKLSM